MIKRPQTLTAYFDTPLKFPGLAGLPASDLRSMDPSDSPQTGHLNRDALTADQPPRVLCDTV